MARGDYQYMEKYLGIQAWEGIQSVSGRQVDLKSLYRPKPLHGRPWLDRTKSASS